MSWCSKGAGGGWSGERAGCAKQAAASGGWRSAKQARGYTTVKHAAAPAGNGPLLGGHWTALHDEQMAADLALDAVAEVELGLTHEVPHGGTARRLIAA